MANLRKILLIDDKTVVSQVAAWSLDDWPGIKVDCASTVAEGAEKIRGAQYGLAIIDGLLHGPQGLRLAELAVHEKIPVLLTTGHLDMMRNLEAARLPYLPKPFALENLLMKAMEIFADSNGNLQQVRTSLGLLKTRTEALAAVMDRSKRLMDEATLLMHRARG